MTSVGELLFLSPALPCPALPFFFWFCFYLIFQCYFEDLSGETHIQTESSDNEDEDGDQPDMATRTTKKPVNQELIHKMYLLRFRLLHFVNSLHNYIMTRVSQWSNCAPTVYCVKSTWTSRRPLHHVFSKRLADETLLLQLLLMMFLVL